LGAGYLSTSHRGVDRSASIGLEVPGVTNVALHAAPINAHNLPSELTPMTVSHGPWKLDLGATITDRPLLLAGLLRKSSPFLEAVIVGGRRLQEFNHILSIPTGDQGTPLDMLRWFNPRTMAASRNIRHFIFPYTSLFAFY
jgi:hypothetical protein